MAADIDIRVKLDQVESALSQIPGWSKREVRKSVRAMDREWKRAPKAARKAAREAERAFERRMQGIRQVSANVMGDVVNDIGDAVEVMGSFGVAGAAAAGALVAIAGLAAGVGVTVWTIYEMANAAQEAEERLRKVPDAMRPLVRVTREQQQAVSLLDESYTLLTAEFDALVYETGSRLAPTVIRLNREMQVLVKGARLGLQSWQGSLEDLLWYFDELEVYTGKQTRAQVELRRNQRMMTRIVAQGQALELEQRQKRLEVEAAIARTMDQVTTAQEKARRAAMAGRTGRTGGDDEDEGPTLADIERQQLEELEGVLGDIDKEFAKNTQSINASVDAQIRKTEELAQARRDLATSAASALSSVVSAVTDNAQAVAAASLLETIAYQAVAVARAFAEGGPFAGPIAAATAIGAIAPQIAALVAASGQSAPAAGGAAASAPGEGAAATPGAVQTTETAADGTVLVISEFRHEVYDRGTEEALRRSGSPLREGIRRRQRRRR